MQYDARFFHVKQCHAMPCHSTHTAPCHAAGDPGVRHALGRRPVEGGLEQDPRGDMTHTLQGKLLQLPPPPHSGPDRRVFFYCFSLSLKKRFF